MKEPDRFGRHVRDLPHHLLSWASERIARETLRRNDDVPFPVHRIGHWWDNQAEIDVVGVNQESDAILFGEIKWSEGAMGTDNYRDLV